MTGGRVPETSTVPCGSCSACCSSIVMLLASEGDKVGSYMHEYLDLPGAGVGPVLKRKPDGTCVYLEAGRCSIYAHRPVICRVFDCRRWYKGKTRAERRRMEHGNPESKAIFAAGRERLDTLPKEPGTEAPGK